MTAHPRYLTRAQRVGAIEAYGAGVKLDAIAAALGVSTSHASVIARRAGCPPRGRGRDYDSRARILGALGDGARTIPALCAAIGICANTVGRLLSTLTREGAVVHAGKVRRPGLKPLNLYALAGRRTPHSPQQARALAAMAEGANTARDIALDLDLSPAHASALLSQMHDKGLIRDTGRRIEVDGGSASRIVWEVA